jgi:amidase
MTGIDRRTALATGAALAFSATLKAQAAASPIVALDATGLSAAIRARRLSCVEVMTAYLDRIDALNGPVNAVVARQDRGALLAQARLRDVELAQGHCRGPLHGFPHAVKDLEDVRGIVSTQGSLIFKNYVPKTESYFVERLRRGGAIFIGKTNAPEFGLGSQTYNRVYGATGNAYDASKTSGGSSGGASVATALRMLPVADGSDYMGSLRNPTGWNNVFGLRPSIGRVARSGDGFLPSIGVMGPVARTVPDLAMLLSVMAGPDARDPASLQQDPSIFLESLERDWHGTRIAWFGDYSGYLAFEPGILGLCRQAIKVLEGLGCIVEEVRPDQDMAELWRAFVTIRNWQTAGGLADLYADPAKRALLKPEAIWEIERGLALKAMDVTRASAIRVGWYRKIVALFERYSFLLSPSAQVFPFDKTLHWPDHIGDRRMDTYHRWMEVTVPVSLTGCPAINVPVGFGPRGLPMGMQIVGPRGQDLDCLRIAHAYDQATRWVERRPPGTG